jgi:hypothetical protein
MLAIVASMGDRPAREAQGWLDVYLDQKVEEGYHDRDPHRRPRDHSRGDRKGSNAPRAAQTGTVLLEVDEDGIATMRPAEPRLS